MRRLPITRRHRRGNYSVLLALSMTVLFGFSALAIDLSYARMARTELQSATDTITHGAALTLDGTEDGIAAAGDTLFTPLRERLQSIEWRIGDPVPVIPAALGSHAGAVGAARYSTLQESSS